MNFYSIIISIKHQFLGISLYWFVSIKTPNPTLPPHECPPHPNPQKTKFQMACAHEPTQPITHPKTTIIVATEDDRNSAWAYDPTTFGRKMLTNMGWKEGDGLKNYLQGMTNNLIAYYRSDNLGMGGYYRPA